MRLLSLFASQLQWNFLIDSYLILDEVSISLPSLVHITCKISAPDPRNSNRSQNMGESSTFLGQFTHSSFQDSGRSCASLHFILWPIAFIWRPSSAYPQTLCTRWRILLLAVVSKAQLSLEHHTNDLGVSNGDLLLSQLAGASTFYST